MKIKRERNKNFNSMKGTCSNRHNFAVAVVKMNGFSILKINEIWNNL